MASLTELDLPEVSTEQLRRAVRKVVAQQAADAAAPSIGPRSLSGRLPSADTLSQGASALDEDGDAARVFRAMLELGYLVAAADGLGEDERGALAALVAEATGARVTPERLAHELDGYAKLEAERGRVARFREVAAELDDFVAREEAMSFVALISIADAVLSHKELRALLEVGEALGFSRGEVDLVMKQVVFSLKAALS